MGPWDYLHSPPGTRHITVGAGDGPCAILMYGTRTPGSSILYPVEPAAAKHGHSVEVETDDPDEAYKDRPPIERVPYMRIAHGPSPAPTVMWRVPGGECR